MNLILVTGGTGTLGRPLVDTGTPAGRVPDMAGPQVRAAADLARSYLGATGRRRRVQPVWLPGRAAAALRCGHNLATAHASGKITFEQFLAARFHAPAAAEPGSRIGIEANSGPW